jgi:excisionase family DNA binding protein
MTKDNRSLVREFAQDAAAVPRTEAAAAPWSPLVRTLNLEQAAKFLNMHPVTVQEKARAGIIPGAKPGKRWVFLEDDLAAYVRSFYPSARQALQGDEKESRACHSASDRARRIGGPASPTTDEEYGKALGLQIGRRPSSTTIG